MNDLFSLKGKTALVTGGSRGLGLMIARGYVMSGAKVYIASRKAQACERAASELSRQGTCIALPADLSTEEGVKALVSDFGSRESRLDILVNNAGKAWGAPLEEYPDHAWDTVMSVNVKAVFNLTRDLLPFLKKSGTAGVPARIINIGSIAAFVAESMSAYAYGASKAAIHQVTCMLAKELADDHITVNAIAPGRFPSQMTTYVIENREAYEAELKNIPLHRYGEPEDIAGLAICLASRAGAYMTGNIIPLDGGALLVGGGLS